MTRGRRRPQRPAWARIVLGGLALAALAAAWRYTPLSEYLTLARLRDWSRVLRETPWAPIALALAYTPASLVLFPRPLITLLAVITFGTWTGFGCAAAGVLIAALVTYYAGRFLPYETVRRLCGDQIDGARALLHEHGVVSIFALNMVPVPPFAVQGIMAGSMRMSVWQYALGTLLSVAPGLVAATVFGRELASMLTGGTESRYWVLGSTILVFLVFAFAMRHWAQKRLGSDRAAGH